MMFRPADLLNPHLAGLEEYTPIQPFEVLSQRLGIPPQQIVKLDANENPYGPLPEVVEALAEYPHYHIYPDPQQTALREALAEHLGVSQDQVLAGHGADELLDLLCRLFLRPRDRVVTCPPTFGMYSFDARLQGAQTVDVWRLPDYHVDVAAVEELFARARGRQRPKLLFLTSPNNPTGTWLPDTHLRRLLALPVMVVLDEAYVEFADYPSRVSWVEEHENLCVLRTFSKAAGLAGLRLGYGVFPAWLMPHLWKFKQPYNVNVAAAVAGLVSLQHAERLRERVRWITRERQRLFTHLLSVPYLKPVPSQANFILCRVVDRDARALKEALEQAGILVRHYDKPGLDNCIRISVGRPEHTDRLLEALHGLAGTD